MNLEKLLLNMKPEKDSLNIKSVPE
jgi:hypothetical protein